MFQVPIRVRNYAYVDDKDNHVEEEKPVVVQREPDYSRPTKRPVYDYYNGAKYNSKPLYYLPKGADRVPTKGGYPKKATSQTTNNKYFYYVNQN